MYKINYRNFSTESQLSQSKWNTKVVFFLFVSMQTPVGKRCKFLKKKICLFSHVTQAFDDSKSKELIKKLTKKVGNVDKKVEELQTNLTTTKFKSSRENCKEL